MGRWPSGYTLGTLLRQGDELRQVTGLDVTDLSVFLSMFDVCHLLECNTNNVGGMMTEDWF